MKLEHSLTPHTKTNSKLIKDLNVRPESLKLLESIDRILFDINSSKVFFDQPPGFPGGSGKESACQYRRCRRWGLSPRVRKIPWRRKWQPTLVFLTGEFYGQRSLVGCSPWGHHKESGATEQLTLTYLLIVSLGLSRWLSGKDSAHQCRSHRRRGFHPWVRKIPWRRKWQPTPVFLPGKSCRGTWQATLHGVTKSQT